MIARDPFRYFVVVSLTEQDLAGTDDAELGRRVREQARVAHRYPRYVRGAALPDFVVDGAGRCAQVRRYKGDASGAADSFKRVLEPL